VGEVRGSDPCFYVRVTPTQREPAQCDAETHAKRELEHEMRD